MKSLRILASVCAAALLVGLSGVTADASTGPPRLQQLAQAQTDLLLANYVNGNVASPATCSEGQGPRGFEGVFLLPSLSFAKAGGNASFTCRIDTRSVLVDLFGAVATEDHRGDIYNLADGTPLLFTRSNLETICDDVLARFYTTAAPAFVDGHPITGVGVSTRAFNGRVNPAAGLLYQDSVDLLHPGRLAAAYCGHKAVVRLSPGHHRIIVKFSDFFDGLPTIFTYDITVKN
jgi:hypothetical protein